MTLIEVLIAAIVVAIGLLGVASMQIAALQGSNSADYRSRAVDFATALADRMHANLIAVADNDYLQNMDCDAGPTEAIPNCVMTPSMAGNPAIVPCSPRQMASYDLYRIGCGAGVQHSLPGGDLRVSCVDTDTGDADMCSDLSPLLIRVRWQRQRRVTDTDLDDMEEIVMTTIPGVP
jgi:type IV pilus assembly protein PilV